MNINNVKATAAATEATESNVEAVATAATAAGTNGTATSNSEESNAGARFRVLVGQVFRETRPEAKDAMLANIRKTRKPERNFSKVEPHYVHVRVLGIVGRCVALISVEDPTASVQIVKDSFVRGMLDTGSWMPVSQETAAAVRLGDRISAVQRHRRYHAILRAYRPVDVRRPITFRHPLALLGHN